MLSAGGAGGHRGPALLQYRLRPGLRHRLGLTAYALGMRHAFDADHIAAIDNTSRKLMSDHQRALSVGFWFSLGHSSIVFVLVALLALGVRALAGPIAAESSALQQVTHIVGAAVSGTFLYLIGIVNLVILFGIVKAFRRMRHEVLSDDALEAQLANRGVLTRVLVRQPCERFASRGRCTRSDWRSVSASTQPPR